MRFSYVFDKIIPENNPFKNICLIKSSVTENLTPDGTVDPNRLLAFCKKNTKILEIKPKKHPNFFQHISRIKELDYRGTRQTVWRVNADVYFKQLYDVKAWPTYE